MRFVFILLAAILSSRALAEAPRIVAHSKLDFGAYKGDTVAVDVKTAGEKLEAKWIHEKETVCRARRCELDTSAWSLGTHKLVFVTFNEKGSLYLRYRVRIVAAPAGRKPTRVEPRYGGGRRGDRDGRDRRDADAKPGRSELQLS